MAHLPTASGVLGRDALVDALLAHLANLRAAVALVGLPGAGASTLALSVAARFRGIKLVIGGPTAHDDLTNAVGGPPHARLPRVGPALLVIDHDHGTPLSSLLSDVESWRAAAPELRVLVASGGPLGLDGEILVEVPTLSVAEARDLLVRLAPQPAPDFDTLLPLLRGHPLALHLAARRLTVLEPSELAHKIEQDPFTAVRDREAATPRHQSLGDLFEAWWSNLAPADQRTIADLAAFGGPFSREALEHVLPGDADERLDRLQRLVVRGWARRVIPGRWELDPWVSAWARRAAPEVWQAAARRMRGWLGTLVAPLGPDPHRDPNFQQFFAVVGAERDHLYAAPLGVVDPAEIAAAAHLARVGVELELVQPRPGAPARVAPIVRIVDAHRTYVDRRDRLRVHLVYASSLARAARFDEALRSLAAVEGEGSESGDSVVGSVHTYIGDNLLLHGRLEESASHYEQALHDALLVDDRICATTAAMQLAIIRIKQRRHEEARSYAEQALAFSPTDDSPHRQARIWQNASYIYTKLNLHDRAEDLLRRALAVHERAGVNRSGALTRLQIADQALRRRGDTAEAQAWLADLPAVFLNFNDARLEHCARGQIGRSRLLDDPAGAAAALLEAADNLDRLGFPEFVPTFRTLAALGHALLGDASGATTIAEGVLALDGGDEDTLLDAKALATWLVQAAEAADSPGGHLHAPRLREAAERLPEWAGDANLRAQAQALLNRVLDVQRALWIPPDGSSLAASDGSVVNFTGVNARLLASLAQAWPRGLWCDVAHLARAGWPGEDLEPTVAAGRVRVALSALRKGGLRDVLERSAHGWRITPAQPVRIVRPVLS